MRAGELFDKKNLGSDRYSTQADWSEPHYEKMLYDQALLAMAYSEAYETTKDEFYLNVTRDIFAYVFRQLASKEGAFLSAKDADSDHIDDKILTDWNGLMMAALAKSGRTEDA